MRCGTRFMRQLARLKAMSTGIELNIPLTCRPQKSCSRLLASLKRLNRSDQNINVSRFRRELLETPVMKRLQCDSLLSIFGPQSGPDTKDLERSILTLLAPQVLRVALSLSGQSPFSQRIQSAYKSLQACLVSGEYEAAKEDQSELCEICDQEIPFDDMKLATCATGHQFGMYC